jgi:hypothetical protein
MSTSGLGIFHLLTTGRDGGIASLHPIERQLTALLESSNLAADYFAAIRALELQLKLATPAYSWQRRLDTNRLQTKAGLESPSLPDLRGRISRLQ